MQKNTLSDADYECMHRGVREKHHRLPRECYRGCRTIVFTICGSPHCCNLADKDFFQALLTWLKEACAQHNAEVLAFTLMPDHMHAVIRGITEKADLWAAIALFKQKAGFHGKRFPGFQLQKDFYDHIVREKEEPGKHINYVLGNPVRAGLVDSWEAYPYSYAMEDG